LFHQGHLFATLASGIPAPDGDTLSVAADVYSWRAIDTRATCAAMIGKSDEALNLWRMLLLRDDIPHNERIRIAADRDSLVVDRPKRNLS
jgi:hypothetical protein